MHLQLFLLKPLVAFWAFFCIGDNFFYWFFLLDLFGHFIFIRLFLMLFYTVLYQKVYASKYSRAHRTFFNLLRNLICLTHTWLYFRLFLLLILIFEKIWLKNFTKPCNARFLDRNISFATIMSVSISMLQTSNDSTFAAFIS